MIKFRFPNKFEKKSIAKKPVENQNLNTNEENFNITLIIALLNLLIYFLSYSLIRYEISGDELYYLACAERMGFGYVDHPPLSIWILGLWKFFLGDSLFVIRILPAVISSTTIVIIGMFTMKLGGKKSAVIISTITFMLTPVFLGASSAYSLNIFNFFFWILSAYIYLLIVQSGNSKLWYILGIVIGLGLLNSSSVVWLIVGIIIGTVLSQVREELKTIYPYIALGIAVLIFSPYIIWNITNDFTHIRFIKDLATSKSGVLSVFSSVLDLFLILNPLSILVWGTGLIYILFNRDTGRYRAFGYIWLVTIAVLVCNWHVRVEYVAPSFQILFIGGALLIDKWNVKLKRLKFALVTPVVALGILLAPLTHPLLPINDFMEYQLWINIKVPNDKNRGIEELSRYCAGMIGWSNVTSKVSEVYLSIPEQERKSTVVYCNNYGEAGAMEYYKAKYKLPEAFCAQNSYWYWGNSITKPTTMIFIGGNLKKHLDYFESVEAAGFLKSKFAMPYDYGVTIFICRGFKGSLEKLRNRDRIFI